MSPLSDYLIRLADIITLVHNNKSVRYRGKLTAITVTDPCLRIFLFQSMIIKDLNNIVNNFTIVWPPTALVCKQYL